MSFEIPGIDLSLQSSGGRSGDQYKAVFATSSAGSSGYAVVAAIGNKLIGVLQENSTEITPQRVRVSGVSKVAAGDSSGMETAITQGLAVVASSKGQAVPISSQGQSLIGYALESLSTGSTGIIAVLLAVGAKSSS